jgi:hypothetical protein
MAQVEVKWKFVYNIQEQPPQGEIPPEGEYSPAFRDVQQTSNFDF